MNCCLVLLIRLQRRPHNIERRLLWRSDGSLALDLLSLCYSWPSIRSSISWFVSIDFWFCLLWLDPRSVFLEGSGNRLSNVIKALPLGGDRGGRRRKDRPHKDKAKSQQSDSCHFEPQSIWAFALANCTSCSQLAKNVLVLAPSLFVCGRGKHISSLVLLLLCN